MPLCAHVSKSFSFRYSRLQEYLEQQEKTSCERMVCGTIVISENVTLLSAEMICGTITISKIGQGFSFLHKVIFDTNTISAHVSVLLGECNILKLL